MRPVEQDDPRVRHQVSAVAESLESRLIELTRDIQEVIERAEPDLGSSDRNKLLQASIAQNVDTAVHTLQHMIDTTTIEAPAAAVEYARRLAQQDVPAAALIRTYRVGQARFLRHCIEELLQQSPGDHLEGRAILQMVEDVSHLVDRIVEQVIDVYETAREGWLRDRSAVLATRVRELLSEDRVDVGAAEAVLAYRLHQHHVGLVLWVDGRGEADSLERLRRLVGRLGLAVETDEDPLFVPCDEASAWAWLPTRAGLAGAKQLAELVEGETGVSVALGEPASGMDGFRRSHRQALSARSVALAAGPNHARITPFIDVAPIAMLCSDLDSARSWIQETLGELATDSPRNAGLRDTARVFLQSGGSYTATAEQLFLHRNTAQYRVRKAEELRGRPLREGRLDVELALLACHWLDGAVLRPAR